MDWQPYVETALRFATPEVFTVVGTLVGGFAAWKTVGWAVRRVAGLVRYVGGAALTFSGVTIAGAASIGWGVAQANDSPSLPAMAITSGVAMIICSMINAIIHATK